MYIGAYLISINYETNKVFKLPKRILQYPTPTIGTHYVTKNIVLYCIANCIEPPSDYTILGSSELRLPKFDSF